MDMLIFPAILNCTHCEAQSLKHKESAVQIIGKTNFCILHLTKD